jgi:hypothetical protein
MFMFRQSTAAAASSEQMMQLLVLLRRLARALRSDKSRASDIRRAARKSLLSALFLR